MLKKLKSVNPTARWWIKGDGTGLWQSLAGEWSGDVDLNNGKLQHQYAKYQATLTWIDRIGLHSSDLSRIRKNLEKALATISSDIDFISSGT